MSTGRKLFITDLHGEYQGLIELLREMEYDAFTDRLVVGGDLIDRGPDSALVVRYLRTLQQMHPDRVIVLTGNHEEMLNWYRQDRSDMWLIHGGAEALHSFEKTFEDHNESRLHMDWLLTLPMIAEDDEYVYVHAGFMPDQPLYEQSRDVLWMSEKEFYAYPVDEILEVTGGKVVVHGHTPCERICFDGARLNCDLGSHTYAIAESRSLALVDLTGEEYAVYNCTSRKITRQNWRPRASESAR
ncbi:metallophosphoesterase family protein [Saccharibacillus sp. JS10]|uniref:metallophosphoesterase family protein n=1 Tax=Saccharibacillus sp. JS10 TaxID=2950552 RepID=UPI00210EC999|nr:metallophosphoesterase family protein [Saccharibacillus sp. JS10]MCQ4086590.1 serine/threonine protein phosphatase [Saccharibacillus sp. JS10]